MLHTFVDIQYITGVFGNTFTPNGNVHGFGGRKTVPSRDCGLNLSVATFSEEETLYYVIRSNILPYRQHPLQYQQFFSFLC